MTSVTILRQLPPMFRYADVEKFTPNANVFLTRLQAKGMVERISRGVYLNTLREARPDIEEIACFLRIPSYISCEWALNRHGVILQSPAVCTVLTLQSSVGKSRNIATGGVTIEFSRIAPKLFTGFEGKDGYNLATPEKALLDAIYLRKHVPFADELDFDAIDHDQLELLAQAFPAMVKKRLNEVWQGR